MLAKKAAVVVMGHLIGPHHLHQRTVNQTAHQVQVVSIVGVIIAVD